MTPATLPSDPFEGASWIWLAEPPDRLFYRALFVRRMPRGAAVKIRLHVTADALYELRLNGALLSRGPLRGDLDHYAYETVEISLPSDADELVFSAAVVPPNRWLAAGMIFIRAGFLLAGELLHADGRVVGRVATGSDWQAVTDPAFERNACDDRDWANTPMGATGYGERVDFRLHANFAQLGERAALPWQAAAAIAAPHDRAVTGKILVPRTVALPQLVDQPLGVCFRPGGADLPLPIEFPPEGGAIFIEHPTLTTGYPRLTFQGGEGRLVRVRHAEVLHTGDNALWRKAPDQATTLGVRINRREQTTAASDAPSIGYYDEFVLAAGTVTHEPSYLRTFRFLKVEVGPGATPARLVALGHTFEAYPLKKRWHFSASDPALTEVAEVAFRTLRLCAHDGFEDAYYERLQYIGDTVIAARLAYQACGDLALGKQAMIQLGWSRLPEAPRLVHARYPSHRPQNIPIFALLWFFMAEDQLRFSGNLALIRSIAPRMAEVVAHFRDAERDGFLPAKDSFIDWAWGDCLEGLANPRSPDDRSALVNLQAVVCLESAARTFIAVGETSAAAEARALARRLREGVLREAYDSVRGVSDAPGLDSRSQHGQIWAILADLVPEKEQHALLDLALRDTSLARTTLYHTFYLFRAAEKLGRYAEVVPEWRRWSDLVARGWSTFPEEEGAHGWIRSACHAWAAWPLGEFLSQVLGVRVLGPRRVAIRPEPCGLEWAEGEAPLPDIASAAPASVRVRWRRVEGGDLRIEVEAPQGVEVEPPPPALGEFALKRV